MKILVVEDDKNLNRSIREMLKSFGEITGVYDGEEAIFMASQNIYDLIILDVMLPTIDGFSVLSEVRKTITCPILMLTALDSVNDKVRGLNLGADDYMTKPFYRDELIARVESLIRRYNNNFQGLSLAFKGLHIDCAHKIVSIDNQPIEVYGKHYDILEYLLRNKEIIIPKEQLFNRIWGFESDTVWSVVEVYISNVRKILKPFDYHKYLKTIRNVGYIWSEKEHEK